MGGCQGTEPVRWEGDSLVNGVDDGRAKEGGVGDGGLVQRRVTKIQRKVVEVIDLVSTSSPRPGVFEG